MTLSANKTPFHRYFPGSAQAPEALDFEFFDAADIVVEDSSGASKTEGVDYDISGDSRTAAASITALVNVDSEVEWFVWSETPGQQQVDLGESKKVNLEDFETELDRVGVISRETRREVARAVKAQRGETLDTLPSVSERAGKAAGYDAQGNPIAFENDPVAAEAAALAAATSASSAAEGAAQVAIDRAASETAKAQAETARDAAVIGAANGGSYTAATVAAAITAGAAATTDGQYFDASGDDVDYVQRARNDAGSATLLFRFAKDTKIDGLVESVSSSLSDARAAFSREVSALAIASRDTSLVQRTLSNALATFGLGKAWDVVASVTNAEHQLAAGTSISGITAWLDGGAVDAVKVRGRLYRRSTANVGAPGTGDDVLLADTGFLALDAAIGYIAGQTAGLKVLLPLPDGVVVQAVQGDRLMFALEGYLGDEVTKAQFRWYYANFAGGLPDNAAVGLSQETLGVWAVEAATRAVRLGPATPVPTDLNATAARASNAAPNADVRTEPDHLSARLRATMRPDFLASHRMPMAATAASGGEEGLSRLLGRPAAGEFPGFGVNGVDFGLRSAVGDLGDYATVYAEYVDAGGNDKLFFRSQASFNAIGGWEIKGVRFTDKQIDMQDIEGAMLVEDCFFEVSAGGAGFYPIDHDGSGDLTVRRCEVQGGNTATINIEGGVIDGCYCHFSAGDIVKMNSAAGRSIRVWNTLMRLPAALAHPEYSEDAHSDVVQGGSDLHDCELLGSAFHMPHNSSPFYEASDLGTTSVARFVVNQRREDFYFGGSMAMGGNRSLGLGMANDAEYGRNVFVFNSIAGTNKGSTPYNQFTSVELNWADEGTAATVDLANWGFFACRGHDGELFSLGGDMLPASVPSELTSETIGNDTSWFLQPGQFLIFNWDYLKLSAKARQFIFEFQALWGVDLVRPDGTLGVDMIDGGNFVQPS